MAALLTPSSQKLSAEDLSSDTGLFVTNTRVGYAAGDTNLYRYVSNSPTNGTDPTGPMDPSSASGLVSWGHPVINSNPIQQGPFRQLTPAEKASLCPYIPKEDLDNAQVAVGEMPWYAPSWAYGITRGNLIYFRDPGFTTSTPTALSKLGHELVHVGQYRKGMNWFTYLWSCRSGYARSAYEAEAEKIEAQILATGRGSQP
jgi:hypothetical protein